MAKEKVFVGVSGGVDSSVALLRLKEAGYAVTAVFIKTWQPDFIECTWKQDRLDAMRVSATLGVPFITFDAVEIYKQKVAEYMIAEYREGRTPNPDVMCNEYVKFGAFYDFARNNGADKVATGHYAQMVKRANSYELHRGIDSNKDQSYFLWRLKVDQFPHILFPIGNSYKPAIRAEAMEAHLPTYAKQDSQGICFLGQVDIKDFLSHYVTSKQGDVLDTGGAVVGRHDGALFYTLGQRHGFTTLTKQDTEKAYYVIAKDIIANTLTVDHTPPTCMGTRVTLCDVNIFDQNLPEFCSAQFRYRQKPFKIQVERARNGEIVISLLEKDIELPSVGQSCVFYEGDHCLGGGVIQKF
ncbi:MAG: tRNA 2-thiouridine(34) synthase MnmA [Candidatus Kaiserbacteria bacterium]|nr:tRNA 2-thiouridine(34) synthase MnmA [Candidatus Kaiserbacteria bacterium]